MTESQANHLCFLYLGIILLGFLLFLQAEFIVGVKCLGIIYCIFIDDPKLKYR